MSVRKLLLVRPGSVLGASETERSQNFLRNAFHFFVNLGIPKSQNLESSLFKHQRSARIIVGLRGVLAAIEFHDQLRFDAGEIGDITINRNLAAELERSQLTIAQAAP